MRILCASAHNAHLRILHIIYDSAHIMHIICLDSHDGRMRIICAECAGYADAHNAYYAQMRIMRICVECGDAQMRVMRILCADAHYAQKRICAKCAYTQYMRICGPQRLSSLTPAPTLIHVQRIINLPYATLPGPNEPPHAKPHRGGRRTSPACGSCRRPLKRNKNQGIEKSE